MMPLSHIAKAKFAQEKYKECAEFCTKAVGVGKKNKANGKILANAVALRGKAHKEMGESAEAKEDFEKAVKFLNTIATSKARILHTEMSENN